MMMMMLTMMLMVGRRKRTRAMAILVTTAKHESICWWPSTRQFCDNLRHNHVPCLPCHLQCIYFFPIFSHVFIRRGPSVASMWWHLRQASFFLRDCIQWVPTLLFRSLISTVKKDPTIFTVWRTAEILVANCKSRDGSGQRIGLYLLTPLVTQLPQHSGTFYCLDCTVVQKGLRSWTAVMPCRLYLVNCPIAI